MVRVYGRQVYKGNLGASYSLINSWDEWYVFPPWSCSWLVDVPSQMKTIGRMTIRMRETGQMIVPRTQTHRMTPCPILLARSGTGSHTLVGGLSSVFVFPHYLAIGNFLASFQMSLILLRTMWTTTVLVLCKCRLLGRNFASPFFFDLIVWHFCTTTITSGIDRKYAEIRIS